MSREKQIEEMAKTICKLGSPCQDCYLYQNDCRIFKYAKCLYNAGYRKQSDVAMEIFEDLESQIVERNGLYNFPIITHEFIFELKKKYTGESHD